MRWGKLALELASYISYRLTWKVDLKKRLSTHIYINMQNYTDFLQKSCPKSTLTIF